MGLADEWQSLQTTLRRVADDLTHLDVRTAWPHEGQVQLALHTRISMDGDVVCRIGVPRVPPSVLDLHTTVVRASLVLNHERVTALAKVARAVLG
jgi:hypothetical protein